MPLGYREPKLVKVMLTIDRIDAMLRALDMPTTSNMCPLPIWRSTSTAGQGLGAIERKLRIPGLLRENRRNVLHNGVPVLDAKGLPVMMTLGERVIALEQRLGIVGWMGNLEKGLIAIIGGEMEKLLAAEGITVTVVKE